MRQQQHCTTYNYSFPHEHASAGPVRLELKHRPCIATSTLMLSAVKAYAYVSKKSCNFLCDSAGCLDMYMYNPKYRPSEPRLQLLRNSKYGAFGTIHRKW